MNIDLEISNLVKAARVKQAKEGLKKSVEKWNSFHWGGAGSGTDLFSGWLKVMYGEAGAEVDIRDRVAVIFSSHVKTNELWYQGVENAPHFHFIPPIECLAMDVEKELGSSNR
ncbi:MAG: hypothetical protein HOG37_09925 [Gammaproteobacteria bacterium]|nr:hypothetical protein [Gammaproteobacteria bacterium]